MLDEPGMLRQLADYQSRTILQFTLDKHKTVEEISRKLKIPLSTTYRKINELKDSGLLVVEKSAITDKGKICDLYRSTIKSMRVDLNSQRISWDITFNDAMHDKIMRAWNSIREVR